MLRPALVSCRIRYDWQNVCFIVFEIIHNNRSTVHITSRTGGRRRRKLPEVDRSNIMDTGRILFFVK